MSRILDKQNEEKFLAWQNIQKAKIDLLEYQKTIQELEVRKKKIEDSGMPYLEACLVEIDKVIAAMKADIKTYLDLVALLEDDQDTTLPSVVH